VTGSQKKAVVNSNCDAQASPFGHVTRIAGYILIDRKSETSCEDYSVKVSL
jgi:hypothetical protein